MPAEHAYVADDGTNILADVRSPAALIAAPRYSGPPVSDDADRQIERMVRETRDREPWPPRTAPGAADHVPPPLRRTNGDQG